MYENREIASPIKNNTTLHLDYLTFPAAKKLELEQKGEITLDAVLSRERAPDDTEQGTQRWVRINSVKINKPARLP